jgi:UTP--glucose-1-phosphate uridylyltransferase
MRPATHAVPKALLPIIDRPAVQYVVEEAVAAGAREIILVADPDGRELLQAHFDAADLAGDMRADVRTVVQQEPLGLGHAIGCVQHLTANRPFMCLLADNVARPGHNIMSDLLAAFEGTSVVALKEVSASETSLYGVVSISGTVAPNVFRLKGAVEKPGPTAAPSRYGLIGRYVFAPQIFPILDALDPGHGGEIQLTDAIDRLAAAGDCIGAVTKGSLLDTGRPEGMLEASAVMGLADSHLREDYLRTIDAERPPEA